MEIEIITEGKSLPHGQTDRQTYEYDSLNRVEFISDKKILSVRRVFKYTEDMRKL